MKIFNSQTGYPCPDTMELTPAANTVRLSTGMTAECRCPTGTAQLQESTHCYKLFEQGPCDNGQYFAPVAEDSNTSIVFVLFYRFFICYHKMSIEQ